MIFTDAYERCRGNLGQIDINEIAPMIINELQRLGQKGNKWEKVQLLNFKFLTI